MGRRVQRPQQDQLRKNSSIEGTCHRCQRYTPVWCIYLSVEDTNTGATGVHFPSKTYRAIRRRLGNVFQTKGPKRPGDEAEEEGARCGHNAMSWRSFLLALAGIRS